MEVTKKRKRYFGDRYDGYKVREQDPMFRIVPYIMRSRLDSQVFFDEQIDSSALRKFILEHRSDIPNLSTYHIIVAAAIRTIAQKPRLNRFVSGNKIYARNYIRASLTVKQSMNEDADESLVMPEFEPTDTLYDVARKFNESVSEVKAESNGSGNNTDFTIKLINMLPGFLIKFVVWTLRKLDGIGKMPKIINRVSPFHSSLYVTNVGSIGINSVYHHLYEFGTTSIFLAIGKNTAVREINSDGTVCNKNMINIRLVIDERICDGFYCASAIRHFKRLLKNPESLLAPPGYIKEDR